MKKNIRLFVSLVLSIALVLGTITVTPAETIAPKKYNFPDNINLATNYTSEFYYSDNYFAQSSYNYNPSLATMSMCMASAASGTVNKDGFKGYSKNLRDLYKAMGFDTIYFNQDFDSQSTRETIGCSFAKRTIKVNGVNNTLIAVNMRNTMYTEEWYSNLDMGVGTEHKGFTLSMRKVKAELEKYVTGLNIKTPVKLWITGYSRGSAISNCLSKSINSDGKIGNVNLKLENIYTYTFGCANTTTGTTYGDKRYKNIFNVFVSNDLISMFPPERMGWHRYGSTVLLNPTTDAQYKAKKAAAQKFLDKMVPGAKLGIDTIPGVKLDLSDTKNPKVLPTKDRKVSEILSNLIPHLSDTVGTSEKYAALQPTVNLFIQLYLHASSAQLEGIENDIIDRVDQVGFETIVADIMLGGQETAEFILSVLDDNGIQPEDDIDKLRTSLAKSLGTMVDLVLSDQDTIPNDVATLALSIKPVLLNHAHYAYLAWLQSFDPNYNPDPVNPTPTPSVVKKPGKAKIVKLKKKSSKKIQLKLKKVSEAKGYKVYVYNSKKKAKKKSGAIASKLIKKNKTTITITSKKFKKAKRLYVRVRAFKNNKGKKLYGAWSKTKKIKMK